MGFKKKKILIVGQNSYIGNSFERFIKKYNNYICDKISVRDNRWKSFDFSKYDSVFYVTGIAHSDNGRISKERAKMYYEINTNLTIDVAKKAKKDGAKQLIYMSSAIVYGDSAPIGQKKVISIDTLPSPLNVYGDSKLKAELGLSKLKSNSFKISIIRSPMVYGDNCKGNYKTLNQIANIAPVFPDIDNERSVIHINRLCYFIKYLIDNKLEGIFLPQDDEYMNTSQMVYNIAKVNGRRIILLQGLNNILMFVSNFTPYINKAFGNFVYEKAYK